jgi:hypothetical protein
MEAGGQICRRLRAALVQRQLTVGGSYLPDTTHILDAQQHVLYAKYNLVLPLF